MDRKTNPSGFLDSREVHKPAASRYEIGTEHSEKNRDDANHTPSPNVADNDDDDCKKCYPPVALTVADCRAGEDEADADDYRACHHRREESHHFLCSESGDEPGEDEIQKTCTGDADAGIRQ